MISGYFTMICCVFHHGSLGSVRSYLPEVRSCWWFVPSRLSLPLLFLFPFKSVCILFCFRFHSVPTKIHFFDRGFASEDSEPRQERWGWIPGWAICIFSSVTSGYSSNNCCFEMEETASICTVESDRSSSFSICLQADTRRLVSRLFKYKNDLSVTWLFTAEIKV